MLKTLARVRVLRNHICYNSVRMVATSNGRGPTIIATPSLALVDEKIAIQLQGLQPHQMVTLVAKVAVDKAEFESRAVYQANRAGEVDITTDTCLGGTYLGKDAMGLFWSLRPSEPDTRFIKKDVTTPYNVDINVFDGVHEQGKVPGLPLTSTVVEQLFMAPGTTRLHVNNELIRGTIFIPPGKGPFPAVMDTYGGVVSLIETRAALLSAQGYVTVALSYLHSTEPGTKRMLMSTCMDYIKGAVEWACEQEYVDENRVGLLGLCYGGFLFFQLATLLPQIKGVVNINGLTYFGFCGDTTTTDEAQEILSNSWPDSSNVYNTEEGIVIREAMRCEKPYFVQAWEHGAKVLLISGGDDKQVDPVYHRMCYDSVPQEYKDNVQYIHYPGAGHLIEAPYLPHVRAVRPGRSRMSTIDFVPEKYHDEAMMTGGFPEQHAYAQEDSWRRIKEFFNSCLKT